MCQFNPEDEIVHGIDPTARPRVWLVCGWAGSEARRPTVSATRYTYSSLEAVQQVAHLYPHLDTWTVRAAAGTKRGRPIYLEAS